MEALSPRLGPPKAHLRSVWSDVLTVPMVAGNPYTYSIALRSLDALPIGVELWGATAECGGDVDLLVEQQLDARTSFSGTVCSTFVPAKAFTHVLLLVRSEGGIAHDEHAECAAGTCQGTDGFSGPWPGKSQPFCDGNAIEECEACLDMSTCDAPAYTDHGNGTVTSSCCGLTWQQTTASRSLSYAAATAYCESLDLAGGAWRMPTLGELLTLLDGDSASGLDPVAFPSERGDTYWSSTRDYPGGDYLHTVHFRTGGVGELHPTRSSPFLATGHVRCVR